VVDGQDPAPGRSLPACNREDASATNQPCWRLAADATSCPKADHRRLVVEGQAMLPADAYVSRAVRSSRRPDAAARVRSTTAQAPCILPRSITWRSRSAVNPAQGHEKATHAHANRCAAMATRLAVNVSFQQK